MVVRSAGYSGTPLAQKLGIKPGSRVLLLDAPAEFGDVVITRRGERFALVGRDSIAVSRALVERHLGRPVGDSELWAAIAKDLGVEPARLHPVEQPWVFHLDMALTLLRPGTVVMNDAFEAFKLQAGWMREDYEAWRPRRESFTSDEAYGKEFAAWREAGVAAPRIAVNVSSRQLRRSDFVQTVSGIIRGIGAARRELRQPLCIRALQDPEIGEHDGVGCDLFYVAALFARDQAAVELVERGEEVGARDLGGQVGTHRGRGQPPPREPDRHRERRHHGHPPGSIMDL